MPIVTFKVLFSIFSTFNNMMRLMITQAMKMITRSTAIETELTELLQNSTKQQNFISLTFYVKANTRKCYFLLNWKDKSSLTIQELLGESRRIEKLSFSILTIDELFRLIQYISAAKMVTNEMLSCVAPFVYQPCSLPRVSVLLPPSCISPAPSLVYQPCSLIWICIRRLNKQIQCANEDCR